MLAAEPMMPGDGPPEEVEKAYQEQVLSAARSATGVLFALIAASFLLAPLLAPGLIKAAAAAPCAMWLLQSALVLPASLLALGAQSSMWSPRATERATLIAVAAVGLALTLMSWLWPRYGVNFPPHMTALFVFGAMTLTGVRPRYMIPLGLGLLALNSLSVYLRLGAGPEAHFEALSDVLCACIASTACLYQRRSHARQWRQTRLRERQAFEDPLTGLPNRRAFDKRAAQVLAQARREQRPVALAMIDLDHFKAVNDRHGHAAGDAVLKAVGRVLHAYARRPLDCTVRFGGDEFAVLWFDVGTEQAERLSRALLRELKGKPVAVNAQLSVPHPGVSIGVVAGDSHHLDLQQLQAMADAALYESKRAGRGRVRLHALPESTGDEALGEPEAST